MATTTSDAMVVPAAPEWARHAAIYQLNLRCFTPEGTLRAAEAHLPRLQELGVGILQLLPIHPIGTLKRKGSLGSPYSIRDHTAVNPELGSLEDLQRFVSRAHQLGLRVILDWVANHTARDHVWTREHPEWFTRDAQGDFQPTPWYDWSDVIDLDWKQPGLWDAMEGALLYWLRVAQVDGFRCDVAGFVPLAFWQRVRKSMDAVRPVFLLAEWESRDLHDRAFDASYAWSWYDAVQGICAGTRELGELRAYYGIHEKAWSRDAMRLTFVSNHDKNAWCGTAAEQFGVGLEAALVLSLIGEGMPLLHNGLEADETKRLAFFDKDQIEWRDDGPAGLISLLLGLVKAHPALWNAGWGAPMVQVSNSHPGNSLSFLRTKGEDRILCVINFTNDELDVLVDDSVCHGRWRDSFSGRDHDFIAGDSISLAAWGWRIFNHR